jgi:hypothetical protein
VHPTSIVEAFNVLEAPRARLVSRFEVHVELDLKGCEEALGHGVVPTISAAAHAANHAVRFELAAVDAARVLAALIGLMDQSARRTSRAL